MTLGIKQRLGLFRFFVTALLLTLIGVSCENASQQKDTANDATETPAEKEPAVELPPLADSLSSAEAATLIQFFQAESLADLSKNFFFGGNINSFSRVISLQLNPAQQNAFYKRLDAAKQNSTQAVSLQVHMALRTGGSTETVLEAPNVVPLLVLALDNTPDTVYYPIRPFSSVFLTSFKELYGWQEESTDACPPELGCGAEQFPIGSNCVEELVSNWNSTPEADIIKQLYVNQNTTDTSDRIRYYTFDTEDTQEIYAQINRLKEMEKSYYFYLHFGQLPGGSDCIPFRNIIHIDDNPIASNLIPARAKDVKAYFEFAKPCPPYCGD